MRSSDLIKTLVPIETHTTTKTFAVLAVLPALVVKPALLSLDSSRFMLLKT